MSERRRLAVRLTPDALRQVRGGHPWVYTEAITSITGDGRSGDLAVIFDEDRKFAAIGLFDPDSPIRLKVLHRGRPVTIDAGWWRDQIGASALRRGPLAHSTATTAYRVVHGENDGLPGLVVDRYGDVAVVKLYSAALGPHLEAIVAGVVAALSPVSVVLRRSRAVAAAPAGLPADGAVIHGNPVTAPVAYRELGLNFAADVVHGQKTGSFLDQRENRALVAGHASGARMLDVFSGTGGFGIHAASGGARSVHFVDRSVGAIETALANRDRNLGTPAVAGAEFTSAVGDAFTVMAALASGKRRFDVVVVDPPSFAQNQAAIAGALRAYRQLTALAVRLVEPGGLLFQASCSSRVSDERFVSAVLDEAAVHGRRVDVIAHTGAPADHPVGFPQGAYLKAVLARVP